MAHSLVRCSVSVRAIAWVAVFLFFLFGAAPSQANTIYYEYTGVVNKMPVKVMASFTVIENQIEIAIWNLQADIKGDIATINSIEFVLSGGQTAATITGRSGMEVTFPNNGSNVAPVVLPGGTSAFTDDPDPGWHLTTPTLYKGRGIKLTTLEGNNDHTIVGPPGPGGVFSEINGSMPSHNPFLYTPNLSTPVTFTLSVPGVHETDTVTGVRFTLGTGSRAQYDGWVTPEPGTWCLVGTGLLGAFVWRRRRSKSGS